MDASIVITGFSPDDLSFGAQKQLKEAKNIVLHTGRCYLSGWLEENGIAFSTLDEVYESAADFDEHIDRVLALLEQADRCTFCVMDTSDETAKALVRRQPSARVYGGGAFAGLEIRSEGSFVTLSATQAVDAALSPLCGALVREIDTRLLAGEVKLKLEDVYGEEASVYFRMPEGDIAALKIDNLDRLKAYDHRCACLINPAKCPKVRDFEGLKLIYRRNAVKDGCLSEETLAQSLAFVVQSICTAEERALFEQRDVFERAAEILTNHLKEKNHEQN